MRVSHQMKHLSRHCIGCDRCLLNVLLFHLIPIQNLFIILIDSMFTRTFALLPRLFYHSFTFISFYFVSVKPNSILFHSPSPVSFLFCFHFSSSPATEMNGRQERISIYLIDWISIVFGFFLVSLFVSYKFFKLQLKTVFFSSGGIKHSVFFFLRVNSWITIQSNHLKSFFIHSLQRIHYVN